MRQPVPPEFLDLKRLMERLPLSERLIRRLATSGQIRSYVIAGRRLFVWQEVAEDIRRRTRGRSLRGRKNATENSRIRRPRLAVSE